MQLQKFQSRQPAKKQQKQSGYQFLDAALGMVSTRSFPAIVGTADMMVKSAGVTLVGYEQIGGGYCTAIVRGKIGDIRLAVEEGAKVAEQFGQLVAKSVIARPMPNLEAVFPLGSNLLRYMQHPSGYSRLSNEAIGLVETRGFPAMVGACDAMLKSADVWLSAYETIGDGLCTAIIRGSVSDVAVAVEAGMHEAERIGDLNAVMVIPRPLDDLEQTLPMASCWVEDEEEQQQEQQQPTQPVIQLSSADKSSSQQQEEQEEEEQPETETESEAVKLPELDKLKIKQEQPETESSDEDQS
jgi:carbon dioxide concentrating mechanism protein CcmO